MIFEIAYLKIDPANSAAFEEAVAKAAPLFQSAKGCHGMSLSAVIETPGAYQLRVKWESVEAHMTDFRNSEAFQQWRGLVGDYISEPPVVEHTQLPTTFF